MAEGLKENSTLTNLRLAANRIGPEGAKAWCLVWMVRTKDIARSKIRALESEVSEMLKRSERNAECSLTMFSILPAMENKSKPNTQRPLTGLFNGKRPLGQSGLGK